jgi:pimeloyl-ACP methyl ester carboxylesterase
MASISVPGTSRRPRCGRPRSVLAALVLGCVAACACGSRGGGGSTAGAVAANTTEPTWVVRQSPRAQLAVVFIHGIFGDTIGTWTNANGARFFDLVNTVPGVAGKADILAFGFPSNMFQAGSFDIREAANRLHLRLDSEGVLDYQHIAFVAHSMGGLVVLRELLTHPEVRDKVPVIVFLGTPQEGSDITRIARYVANNPALAQMTPADGNDLLKTLSDEWNSVPVARRPHVRCAYEKLPTFGVLIVPWSSATRFCEGAPPAINANHLDLVKPDRADRDSVVVVTTALKAYVLNRALEPRLETPDFRAENGQTVMDLASAVGRQSARLVNAGGASLHFTLAEISDPALFVWPDDTPKELPANSTTNMFLALGIGARATEYQFLLRSDVAPDRRVTVRVPSLAAVRSEQMRRVQDVAGGLESLLADDSDGPRLRSFSADDGRASASMLAAARDRVARDSPDLPSSAQWTLTADVLNAMNWPGLAAGALREAEKASPAAARTPGVRHLAATVAALSGDPRVFAQAPTPALTAQEVAQLPDANLLVGADAARAARLATQLRQVPALKALGLSLDGDVKAAAGDHDAARRSLEEAATIRRTPSVSRRLGSIRSSSPARGRAATATLGR